MNRRMRTMLAAGALAAVAATGTAGIAIAGGADDDSTQVTITGVALEKASAAALAFTGGGRVTETEQGDEDSFYEVEVTLDDGSEVDVQLDEEFNVVSSKKEAPGAEDAD